MNLWKYLFSVSEEVSGSLGDQPVDPVLGSLVMVGSFAVVVVIFTMFVSIIRKDKNKIK